MKGSKEHKRWVKNLVKVVGKKNGLVSSCYFDSPEMERKSATDKKIRVKQDRSWKYELE
jgi:hypothetical protein